ncbi:pseudaminic acid cytidylyltransferase [Desulfocurvibacter africanus]|uniref:pseudaminic acid cytidylyltransferase n=1 Tax=Desulfocurvibacter africanus TaxID=873 RepID=UPI002FDA3FBB
MTALGFCLKNDRGLFFMRRVAIIPARGGSKRLPRKNIVNFHGKPIIAYTIEAGLSSGLFEQVIVSTEDEEIAQVAAVYGAEVAMRPHHLATDTVGTVDVCLDLLGSLETRGLKYDVLCCLYATAPLRTADDIAGTVRLLDSGEVDFAFAVTDYPVSPYQALIAGKSGYLDPAWPLIVHLKSQELPTPLVGNGSTYAARVNAFRRERSFYGPHLKGYMMPRMRSVDIDTAEDLTMALWLAKWPGTCKE